MSVVLNNKNHQRVFMNPATNNKGQMKIQQMVFMLLAVTLFFVLVGLFFISFKTESLASDAESLKLDKAAGLVERISSNPEFIFEESGISNAVDFDKLMILKEQERYRTIENGRRKTFWGVKGIIVRKIYPLGESVECTRNTYPDCNLIKIFTSSDAAPIASFVSLCSKKSVNGIKYSECELAELMIEEEEVNV